MTTEFERYLSEGERNLLAADTVPRKRALALAQTVQLAQLLELSDDASADLVGSMRERLEGLTAAEVKKVRRNLGKAASLLGRRGDESEPADMPVAPDDEAVIAEPASMPDTLSEPSEPEPEPEPELPAQTSVEVQTPSIDQERHQSPALSTAAEYFLTKMIGEDRAISLTTDDAPRLARALLQLYSPRRRSDSVNYERLLENIFQNGLRSELAQELGTSRAALEQAKKHYRDRFSATVTPEVANEQLFSFLGDPDFPRSEVIPPADKAISTSVIEAVPNEIKKRLPRTPRTQPTEPEREMPNAKAAIGELVSLIGAATDADEDARNGIANFFNPDGISVMSTSQSGVPGLIERYIGGRYGTIDNPALNLDDEQKSILRRLTGAWRTTVSGADDRREPRNLSNVIGLDRHAKHETIARLHDAVTKLFASDEQSSKGSERNAKTVIELARGAGLTEPQALALWNQLHFHDGDYTTDSKDGQSVAAKLLRQLGGMDHDPFGDDAAMRVIVKMFVFRGMGFNNLDMIYDRMHAKDDTVSKSDIEQKLVSGITRLLQ